MEGRGRRDRGPPAVGRHDPHGSALADPRYDTQHIIDAFAAKWVKSPIMGSRNALVDAVRQELAVARGAARAVLAAAESARGEAQNRRRLIRDAYATCLNQLAEARDAARRDIQRRYQYESARLAGNVRRLAALSATGAAGAPWRLWAPTEPAAASRPGLLRIGTLTLADNAGLPGLVPLLDAAHLAFTGPAHTADGV